MHIFLVLQMVEIVSTASSGTSIWKFWYSITWYIILTQYPISYYYLLILGICCGNCDVEDKYLSNREARSCDLCPKLDTNISNQWCSGDCVYDHIHHICREGK